MDGQLVDRLADLPDSRARARLLRRHREAWSQDLLDRLETLVIGVARADLRRAERLALAA